MPVAYGQFGTDFGHLAGKMIRTGLNRPCTLIH